MKTSYNSVAKQTNNLVNKWAALDPNRHFFQEKHTYCQEVCEKMLYIIHHQENANQNHNEVSPHTC